MTPLENDLTTLLREHHDDVVVPMPPTADLLRLGEDTVRRRRRRTVLFAAAVLVPVLAVTPWLLLRDDDVHSTPSPSHGPRRNATSPAPAGVDLASLPQGIPLQAPYLLDHRLMIGDGSVPTKGDHLLAGGFTAFVERTSGTDPTWWRQADGGTLAEVPDLQGAQGVKISALGSMLAWTSYPDSSTTRVTAWSPGLSDHGIHVDLPAAYVSCCGGGQLIELQGIDNNDNVYWRDADGKVQVWHARTGAVPHPLTGTPGDVVMIAPKGPVVLDGSTDRLGRVGSSGHWTSVASFSGDPTMIWTSDGRLYAAGLRVTDARTGHHVLLDVPAGASTSLVGFEQDQNVLVNAWVDPTRHYVLRCDVGTGFCERALEIGSGSGFEFTPFPN